VITTGNHAWDQKQIIPYISTSTRLLRPANYPDHPQFKTPGRGACVVQSRRNPSLKLGVIQVMGRVFMPSLDCPFRSADAEVERLDNVGITNIFVDFHGEATSEKQAFAHYMDGKVSAVVGSHSHVQTADERVLAGGTAAITDVGMCGCFDSVIGVKKELSDPKVPDPAIGQVRARRRSGRLWSRDHRDRSRYWQVPVRFAGFGRR
jgi:metallophosphoesterase (TIGR00282 family)